MLGCTLYATSLPILFWKLSHVPAQPLTGVVAIRAEEGPWQASTQCMCKQKNPKTCCKRVLSPACPHAGQAERHVQGQQDHAPMGACAPRESRARGGLQRSWSAALQSQLPRQLLLLPPQLCGVPRRRTAEAPSLPLRRYQLEQSLQPEEGLAPPEAGAEAEAGGKAVEAAAPATTHSARRQQAAQRSSMPA